MSTDDKRSFLASGDLLSMSEAARYTPYAAEYLSLRAKTGKLKAVKVGKNWITTKPAILDYLKVQEERHTKILQSLKFHQRQAGFAGIKILMLLGLAIVGVSGFLALVGFGVVPNYTFNLSKIQIAQAASFLAQNVQVKTVTPPPYPFRNFGNTAARG